MVDKSSSALSSRVRRLRRLFRSSEEAAGKGPSLRSLLPAQASRIAVLDRPGRNGVAERLRAWYPAARVELFDATQRDRDRHVPLTVGRPYDLVVDPSDVGKGRVARLLGTFYHLQPGGMMVVRATDRSGRGRFAGLLAALDPTAPKPSVPLRGRLAEDVQRLAAACTCRVEGDFLVLVSKGTPAYPKLDERQLDRYLSLRPDTGHRIIDVIPGESFVPRGSLREYPSTRSRFVPKRYHAPDVALREYVDVVVSPGQVVCWDGLILPDSYRHNERRRLVSRYLPEVAPWFAAPKRRRLLEPGGLPLLPGTYLHLDNEHRGHFGHVMTELVSRLWSLEQARKVAPELKVLLAVNLKRELFAWERRLLEAAGIRSEDIAFIREPVRVERLISGAPLFSHPEYVHPRIAETWRTLGDRLAAEATLTDLPERIFLTRRIRKRSCLNQPDVEARFVDRGFTLVYPEDHDLIDQVAMFRHAAVIGGFAGSGMFNLAFTTDPKRVVMVGSTRYTARNEFMMAAVLGHRIDSILCEPTDPADFQSPFQFDVDREGPWLAEVLDSLEGR